MSDRRWSTGAVGPFPVLLASFALLYLWRMSGLLPLAPVSAHLSNFYLTGAALTLASGPRAFVAPGGMLRAKVAAGVLVALNIGLEVVVAALGIDDRVNDALGEVNTSDPVDALFGLAAVGLVLALVRRAEGRVAEQTAGHPRA